MLKSWSHHDRLPVQDWCSDLPRRLDSLVQHVATRPTRSAALELLNVHRQQNKNLAIANRSRVSCAQNTSRASIGLINHDLEIWVKGHSRSLEVEPLDRSYTTYY